MTRLSPILAILAPLTLAACLPGLAPKGPSGAEDFADYCAACHGAGGTGDGAAAGGLGKRPADLTLLARKNGGTFPTTPVMAKIWGYTGGRDGDTVMPEFGPLLDSALIPYDGGDGIETPTPLRLVQIAEHLKTLQQR